MKKLQNQIIFFMKTVTFAKNRDIFVKKFIS